MKNSKKSYIYAFLAIFLWASTAAVGKMTLKNLDNIQVLFFSSFFAFLSLFIIAFFSKNLKSIKSFTKKDFTFFLIMGLLGIYLYYMFFYAGLKIAPAQEIFIVNYTWPAWVVVFSIFILGEKFTFKKVIAILFSFFGIFIVATKGNILDFQVENLKGDIFALLGAVSYGVFSVLGKKYDYNKIISTMFYFLFSFVFIALTLVFFSSIPVLTVSEFLGLIWLGIFTSGLAFVFWLSALKYGDTAKISNLVFLTPFLSLIYIYFLLGEKILLSSVIGLVLIVLGIVIQFIGRK